MTRATAVVALVVSLLGVELQAQAIPDNAQATRVSSGYRRPLDYRVDPFRHTFLPGWGLVISAGAWAENNAFSVKDARALQYIGDNDTLLVTDVLDAIGIIQQGAGLGVNVLSESGVFLGGPFGRHLSLGLSAQARAYGSGFVDDGIIAVFRDGNGTRQEFPLGDSRGEGIITGEVGVHAVFSFGPLVTVDGAVLSLGLGGRYLWPQGYARGRSLGAGETLRVGTDTIAASFDIETLVTQDVDEQIPSFDRGTGMAADLLARIEWPTSGFALEGMIANIGKVTVRNVVRRQATFEVNTTNLIEFSDSLDALAWDSTLVDVEVNLPRLVRFSASAWANRILQLDLSTSFGLNTGEYDIPPAIEVGSTWRLVRSLPLRGGIVIGGRQGFGYTGGVAVETGNFLLQLVGGSFGGMAGDATGYAGRFDLGFFF